MENTYEYRLSNKKICLKTFFYNNLNYFFLLFFLTLFTYSNSLNNDFVSDDISAIVKNPLIGKFSNVFSNGILGNIQNLSYFLAYHIDGLNAAYFRIFSILFHLGSVFLIFTILGIISQKRIAIIASLLFAVHPVLTESIVWISGMPYSSSSFFFFLSFFLCIIYQKNNDRKALIASYFSFLLMLTCSEKTMPLFIAFFLATHIYGNLKKDWKKLLPFLILSFTWLVIFATKVSARTESLIQDFYQQKKSYSVFIQVPTAIANYLKLLIWPEKLSLYQTEMNFSSIQYGFMLIFFILFLSAIIFYWRKNRVISFWLLFFIIALSTTLTPIGVAWIVAERYVYLGSLGIFVVVAMFFDWILEKAERQNQNYKYAIYGLFAAIILALSVRTIVRNMDWQNEDTFWIATAKTSPSGPNIHNNLGDVYGRQGNLEKAAEEFQKAIEINPRYADAYHNLGNTYRDMGKYDLAVRNWEKALEINPRLWQSYQNLAVLYFNQENYQMSLENIKKALEINPQDQNLNQAFSLIQSKIK